MTTLNNRLALLRIIKYLFGLLAFALLYVLVDFTVDFRPTAVHASYRFSLNQVPLDQPIWLRQDNLTVLLIRRSGQVIEDLKKRGNDLQDVDSTSSRQPDYAKNVLRSLNEQYFVAYGLGTDLGCPLAEGIGHILQETCGSARYDFAGRAIVGKNQFLNLAIPDYNFSRDFSVLTINL